MTRRRLLVFGLLLAVTGVAGEGSGRAVAETTEVEATFDVEAWYQPGPACVTPFGCSAVPLPPSNPYGEGTLHVAVSAGQETARTYLGLAPVSPPPDALLSRAVLTIPVDASTPGNGSANPSAATLQVCISGADVADVEGAFDDPPRADCEGAVRMTYADAPTPTFTAEVTGMLAELVPALEAGSLNLVVLPAAPTPTSTWRVVFSAHDRAQPPSPPASLRLSFETDDGGSGPVVTVPPDDTPGADLFVLPSSPFTDESLFSPLPPSAAPPTEGAPSTAPMTPSASAIDFPTTVPFQYPAVLLLPAGLFGLAVLIVGVMKADVSPGAAAGGAGEVVASRVQWRRPRRSVARGLSN